MANAVEKAAARPEAAQVNFVTAPVPVVAAKSQGLSIRGLAGPYAIMAQNFAPGTSAADIESAMTPVGGEMVSCTILKTTPMVVAEMVFTSREGGEKVIETFNNQTVRIAHLQIALLEYPCC
jgi:hypothetical protein